jgi:hypothetical protein
MNYRSYWERSHRKTGHISEWITLEKDKMYRMQAWHKESMGEDHFTVAVRVERTLSESDNHVN